MRMRYKLLYDLDKLLGFADGIVKTGVYTWNPNVAQFPQDGQPDNKGGSTLPIKWAATVLETSGVTNASVRHIDG